MAERASRCAARPRLYYLAPDYARPSWGVALLYHHVRLLRELGHDARLLHHRAPFRLDWIESDLEVEHLDALEREPTAEDTVVVPEVLAAEAAQLPYRWRRGVFVQGSFLIVSGLGGAVSYPDLGYSFALAVLPHVAAIVERHFGLRAALVPPFVAPYFFQQPEAIARLERQPLILLAMKPEYREGGFPDYDIFTRILGRALAGPGPAATWELTELGGRPHREVAALAARASFLVNLNSHEAFNTTVPEAMAAGCLPICYQAFGGRDFLVDGENAFVFPNHDVFPLLERTLSLIETAARRPPGAAEEPRLRAMRLRARETAARFSEAATRTALERAFAELGPGPAAAETPPAGGSDSPRSAIDESGGGGRHRG